MAKYIDLPNLKENLTNFLNKKINPMYAKKTEIPSNVSELNNDKNYQTAEEVGQAVTDGVAKIVAGAPEDFDTLKEMSDWISSHETSAAAMNSAISDNSVAIANHTSNSDIHVTKAEKTKWNKLDSDLKDGTIIVAEATKARQDAQGNIIDTTYAKKTEIPEETVVDDALSSTSINPVQNKVVKAEFDKVNSNLSEKAPSNHTHSSYVNQNAFSNVVVGSTTVAADTATDTLTLVAGSNVTITPDATNDKITISATDTNTVTTATTTGSGNAVTAITASNGALTVTKGSTFLTKHQDISGKMNTSNPTGFGSFSLNRKSETDVGVYSFAVGYKTTASGFGSHAEGRGTIAKGEYQHAQGTYNVEDTTSTFIIGNGVEDSDRSNAFSVKFNGVVKAASTITASTTADYAEFFEWIDENPNNEDRVGYFVTLDGNRIKIASDNDDYILGIVSGEPFVLGNGDCDTWNKMYLHDEFRRTIYEPAPKVEEVEIKEEQEETYIDKETGEEKIRTVEVVVGHEFKEVEGEFDGTRPKLNPDYDNTQQYISRFDRKEWSPVGMLGVLAVRHDGTAKVNGYVTVNKNGIATACDRNIENSYRVIKANTDSVVEIIFK